MGMQSAFDVQVGGRHYKDAAMQPAEFWLLNQLPATEGAAVKYLFRWRSKGGVEDLRKARHFIEMMIEAYFVQQTAQPVVAGGYWQWEFPPEQFCEINRLDPLSSSVICQVCRCESEDDLRMAIDTINQLIDATLAEGAVDNDGSGAVVVSDNEKLRAQHAIYVAIDKIEDYVAVLESFKSGNLGWRDAKVARLEKTLEFLRQEARA